MKFNDHQQQWIVHGDMRIRSPGALLYVFVRIVQVSYHESPLERTRRLTMRLTVFFSLVCMVWRAFSFVFAINNQPIALS